MIQDPWNGDKLHEECGVIGIYNDPGVNAAESIYYGLYALQHRGQESAGIAVNNNRKITAHKGMGLVSDVFQDPNMEIFQGNIGIGHVRYSTTGDSEIENAQPITAIYRDSQIALAHNGNLVNAKALRNMLQDSGVIFQTTIDTEVILNLIARNYKADLLEAIKRVGEIIKGAYALVLTIGDHLIGLRDPHGMRPMCLGQTADGYVLASESCALDAIGAKFVRDIEPGEIISIGPEGVRTDRLNQWTKRRLCIFELIYFARPDSVMDGIGVYDSRHRAGKILAEEFPVEADVVVGVPDSGIPAAIGYAEKSGIPYGMGLIKNKYIGRTFIQPSQEQREKGVRIKLNPLKRIIEGKRVVLVDDSIVRGTTSKRLVELLREAGATEVHFLVSSPPVAYSCHFGIDTPYRKQLVASKMTEEEFKNHIGADTLGYISIDGLERACGKGHGYCRACFDGDYPMEVPFDVE
jgi:amidophosphoribosyltransferase